MITHFNLLQNIGQFDSVTATNLPLDRTCLVYAENGRGKTTLASILRSLGSGNSSIITERHRISAQHPPKVVITVQGSSTPFIFQNGAWSSDMPQIAIFDDNFVAQNVYSGIAVDGDHKTNLHEFILGSNGVVLNQRFQQLVTQIEEHNRLIRNAANAIPESVRFGMPIDDFCALGNVDDISNALANAESLLATARSAREIQQQPYFDTFGIPDIDIDSLNDILSQSIQDVEVSAMQLVQAHLAKLGSGSETWISEGMSKREAVMGNGEEDSCPFCLQNLSSSSIIQHYQAFFSVTYNQLKDRINQTITEFLRTHSGSITSNFERSIRIAVEGRQFWMQFISIPEIALDTLDITGKWSRAVALINGHLTAKRASPLESIILNTETLEAINEFRSVRLLVEALSSSLSQTNSAITSIKSAADSADIHTAELNLRRLHTVRSRFEEPTNGLCSTYILEKNSKASTEQLRNNARTALDTYRDSIFPAHEVAINNFLGRFNAGFRLARVSSANNRGGSTCSYFIVINNSEISLNSSTGRPSFSNTLSAGDRNTLALAFFFASLDQDPHLSQKVVIIDDPMTSLDEHRSLNTVHEIRALATRVSQLIILSHSKPFLLNVWDNSDRTSRVGFTLSRQGTGSTFEPWNVSLDSVTEHDRRVLMISAFIRNGSHGTDPRQIASSLRPTLETFMRVAYPIDFPAGSLLGPFINKCKIALNSNQHILQQVDITELESLLDYANKFHHDTNASWSTEVVNEGQLLNFSTRVMAFLQR